MVVTAAGGYTPRRRTFLLRFEDAEYDGLQVRARSVSIGGMLEAAGLASLAADGLRPADLAHLSEVVEAFADALIEWNLTDEDGRPVPATLAGVKSLDADFVLPIIQAWFDGITGVAGPLGPSSSAGPPSAPPPLPMESSPQNRVS